MKSKWAFFDVDGTLTRTRSVWEHLHRELGIWESEGRVNLNDYLADRIDYFEFARRDAAAYKGLHRSELDRILDRIEIRPGIQACFEALREAGFHIGLISTGLKSLVSRFHPVDLSISNELVFHDDVCTGEVIVHLPIDAKGDFFKRFLSRQGISEAETVTVGDSCGDIDMMRQSGLSIAVHPCDARVLDICDVCLLSGDIGELPGIIHRKVVLQPMVSRESCLDR